MSTIVSSSGRERSGPLGPLRAGLADLPLLIVALLLLSTAADILPNDTIVGVGEVQLNLARILVIVGLLAVVATQGLRFELLRTGLALPLLLLLTVSLYASHKYGTYPRFRFLAEAVAVFYLTFAAVRTRRDAGEGLSLIALVALSIAATTAVAQVAQGVHTGFARDGCVPLTLTPGEAPPEGAIARATGTFANPNVLGGYLLLVLPIAMLASAYVARARGAWTAVALGGGLGFLGLVFTFSRAAILMSLIAIGLGVLVSDARFRRYLLLVLVGVAIAIGVLAGSCGSESTAGYGRAQEWRQTLDVIGDEPVYGVGLGRLGFVLNERHPKSTARHAHNLFLTWWAEAGTGALIAWLWLFGMLVWRSLRTALRGSPAARAALVALVGFLGISMLDHPANTDRVALAFWIVAGFAAASADPGRGLLARLRGGRGGRGTRGGGAAPSEALDTSVDPDHEPSLVHRPRTGNVRPVPRGPNET